MSKTVLDTGGTGFIAHHLIDIVNEKIKTNLPVKLHLGCGPNIWEDWINVEGDYIGEQPGIIHFNITDPYPLPDNCVDEIFTSHVIEHIIPTDVEPMMKEWLRILKPGGFVATEWPDLLKCATFLVKNPEMMYTKDRNRLKHGVAGIFGNISKYQDLAMLHKWGYSEESMKVLKLEVGFSRAEIQEPIHPKTRKPMIDSRVVGYK